MPVSKNDETYRFSQILNGKDYQFVIIEAEIFIHNPLSSDSTQEFIVKKNNEVIQEISFITRIDLTTETCVASKDGRFEAITIREEGDTGGTYEFLSLVRFSVSRFRVSYIGCPPNSKAQYNQVMKSWECIPNTNEYYRGLVQIDGVVILGCPIYCQNCRGSDYESCLTCESTYNRQTSTTGNCFLIGDWNSKGIF